jgi:general secretion pathway protein G
MGCRPDAPFMLNLRMIRKQGEPAIRRGHNTGFTLIEVLLVVVIMAVLAGAILPAYMGTADDAKTSSLRHNLSVMQAQLEVYRVQHLNRYPAIQDNALLQLTSATNATGEIGQPGPTYPLGPYLVEAPMNPFDGSKKVTAVAVAGQKPTGVIGQFGGWQYDNSTGAFWPNNSEYYK